MSYHQPPLCKYFMSTGCYYGYSCKFRHDTGDEGYGGSSYNRSRYVYDTRNPRQNSNISNNNETDNTSVMLRGNVQNRDSKQRPANISSHPAVNHRAIHSQSSTPTPPTKEEIRMLSDTLAKLTTEAELGKMWPLTVVSITRNGNLPGNYDYSMEEVRYWYYSANANSTVNEYLDYLSQLIDRAAAIRKIYIRRGPEVEEILQYQLTSNYNFSTEVKPFATVEGNKHDNALSSFSFASALKSPGSSGTFGTSQTDSSNMDVQQPSAFSFANPSSQLFPSNQTTSNSSAFSFASVPLQKPSVFEVDSSVFSSSPLVNATYDGVSLCSDYTPLSLLEKTEIENFKATTFTLGNVPFRPPPKELCLP